MPGFATELPGPGDLRGPRAAPRRGTGPRPSDGTRHGARRAGGVLLALLVPIAAFGARSCHPESYPSVDLGPLACGDRPVTLHLIDDRSGSTWSTDPMHRRERELVQLAQWDTDGSCRLEVAAASFDNVTPPLPPTPARTDAASAGVAAALPVEGSESSSDLAPVLRQSSRWARSSAGRRHVAVIATDGMVDLDETFAALRSFPGEVVVIALGGPLPAEWREVRDRVGRVVILDGQVGLGDVAHGAADAVRSLVERPSEPGTSSRDTTPSIRYPSIPELNGASR